MFVQILRQSMAYSADACLPGFSIFFSLQSND